MVLMPEPVFAAVDEVGPPRPLFLLGPGGRRFDQSVAHVREHLVDGEISVGDFVLAGGEVAAMAVLEAVGRLVPGVMGNAGSADEESFADGLLEYPQYTRPAEFRGWAVPEVLRSGDHGRVARWRRAQALARTIEHRPDLIAVRGGLSDDERRLLEQELGITYPAGSPEDPPGVDAP